MKPLHTLRIRRPSEPEVPSHLGGVDPGVWLHGRVMRLDRVSVVTSQPGSTPDPVVADAAGPERSWPDLTSALLQRQDLDPADTSWAMNRVMSGDATPVQLAGFLVALRAKGDLFSHDFSDTAVTAVELLKQIAAARRTPSRPG